MGSRENPEQKESSGKGQILGAMERIHGRGRHLVQWKGFTAEGDTWESRENLENTGDLLKEFEEEYGRDGQEVKR